TMVLVAITDITERKRHEALLEEAARARDDFLAIASHELRNPVNALQLQLTALLRSLPKGEEAAGLRERVARSVLQVGTLSRLIHNLLDASQISAGYMNLEP